jgi:hypothetical protein
MPAQCSQLLRFVRAVHRRLVVLRAVESAGVGMACAAAGALLLAAALLWQGRNAMPLCAGALAIGAAAGLAWGCIRRPRLMDAAVEADRQLELADLLASAMSSLGRRDDPWHGAVVVLAEQRCQTLSASAVMLARFGGRAWGGIGLAAALLLTIGAMSALPAESRARQPAGRALDIEQPVAHLEMAAPNQTSPAAADANKVQRGEGSEKADDRTVASSLPPQGATRRGDEAGGGSISSKTSASVPDSPAPAAAKGNADDRATAAGSGAGGAAHSPVPGGQAGEGVGGSSGVSPPTSPTQMPAAVSDRDAAERAVRDGRVPDAYRDVVQQYFREDQ